MSVHAGRPDMRAYERAVADAIKLGLVGCGAQPTDDEYERMEVLTRLGWHTRDVGFALPFLSLDDSGIAQRRFAAAHAPTSRAPARPGSPGSRCSAAKPADRQSQRASSLRLVSRSFGMLRRAIGKASRFVGRADLPFSTPVVGSTTTVAGRGEATSLSPKGAGLEPAR